MTWSEHMRWTTAFEIGLICDAIQSAGGRQPSFAIGEEGRIAIFLYTRKPDHRMLTLMRAARARSS